jgi:hypothetical protein
MPLGAERGCGMSDDDKLHTATVRAARAQALLNDELLTEAFDTITRSYLDAWSTTEIKDQDKRERLWHAVQVAGKVKRHLRQVIDGGKLAQREIDDLVGRKKFAGLI